MSQPAFAQDERKATSTMRWLYSVDGPRHHWRAPLGGIADPRGELSSQCPRMLLGGTGP